MAKKIFKHIPKIQDAVIVNLIRSLLSLFETSLTWKILINYLISCTF